MLRLKILLSTLIFVSVMANADELKIYVIKPRMPINWSSPQSLSITSALDSIGNDYAPIGHFAVEVSCTVPNRFGKRHVLTGMERKDKKASAEIILKNGLGLGSLVYSFEGDLQSAEASSKEIASAKKDKRLKVIEIPTSSDRCNTVMRFLENWIDSGSYLVYGGGKQTALGEGAGCADFADELFKIATGSSFDFAWSSHVAIPLSLMGSKDHPVPFTRLLFRSKWAQTGETSLDFASPDGDLVYHWLNHYGRTCGEHYLWSKHIVGVNENASTCDELRQQIDSRVEDLPATQLDSFEFKYSTTVPASEIWDSISL